MPYHAITKEEGKARARAWAKEKPKAVELVRRYLRAKGAAKRNYQAADALLEEIAAELKPGQEITITKNGKRAVLVDSFEGKSILWGHGAVRRWELEVRE